MHGRSFLPEGALGEHDRRARLRERQVRQESGRITFDRSRLAGLAGRASSEIHQYLRSNETVIVERRLVSDVEPLAFRAHPCCEAIAGEAGLHRGQSLLPDPGGELVSDRFRPALLLAAGRRQRLVASAAHEIGGEGANVVGDVDVFGKPPDGAPDLRQRRTAFEGKMASERCLDENFQGFDNPDVLLQQVCSSFASIRGDHQGVTPICGSKRPERRLSHRRPARLPVPPSTPA